MNEAVLKILVLWTIYLAYMLIGAAIFMELEHGNEKSLVKHFNKVFEEFHSKRNLSDSVINDLSRIYRQAYSLGIDPNNPYHRSKWDFAGSFYFVGTVLTTIGFGLTAPITTSGQILFLVYALLGIPLNVLLFNTLLDHTVQLFTCTLSCLNRHWRRRRHASVNLNGTQRTSSEHAWEPSTVIIAFTCLIVIVLVILLAAPLFVFLEEWSFFESVYFSVVAFTTVGFGDFVPGGAHRGGGENLQAHYRIGNWLVIILGTLLMYTTTALMASVYKRCLEDILEQCRERFRNNMSHNRITASPSVTPTNTRERTPSLSPLKDQRKREMAARALRNWRAVKTSNIGPVNQVEESMSRMRRSMNDERQTASRLSTFSFLSIDNSHLLNTEIKRQTSLEELVNLEVKLTKEFNQLIKDIEQQRQTLTRETTSNDERGIDNGVVIRVSSPEATSPETTSADTASSPPLCMAMGIDHERTSA